MPRGRRVYQASRAVSRSVTSVPARYAFWMSLTGVDPDLSGRLWDALGRVAHPTAQRLCWFFTRLEGRPVRDIPGQMVGLQQRVPARAWIEVIEHCVTTERLTRAEGNAVMDAILHWTAADGSWRYG